MCAMIENHNMSMAKLLIKEPEINICKGLFVCIRLFNLKICCRLYTHYGIFSVFNNVKWIGERSQIYLIPSDCIQMHVPKILVNGMYHRWRDMYLKNPLLRTDADTLATVVLPNAAVFSVSVGCLKCHWMRSFHFLKACSCLLEGDLGRVSV